MRRVINVWASLDWFTIFLYFLLVFMGWLNIYAAVYSEQHKSIFDFDMRYGKQILWIVAALLIAAIIIFIDTRFYSYFAYVIYAMGIFMLIIVLVLGKDVKGSRSWFEIGALHLQPSEFVKVVTCLALAKYLSSYSVKIEKFKTFIIFSIIILIPMGLIILQPDIGSMIIFISLIFVLYREGFPGWLPASVFLLITLFILALIADKMFILLILIAIALSSLILLDRKYRESIFLAVSFISVYWITSLIGNIFHLKFPHYNYLLYTTVIISAGFVLYALAKKMSNLIWIVFFLWVAVGYTYSVKYVFTNFLAPHQQHRVNILLGKEIDPGGAGYNINQSKIAIGSGGFSGKGYLQGTQTKFNFVPEQSTDFIFCTVGEEWGFLGSFLVLAIFVTFLLRLIYLAERQRSAFSRIFGYGVVSILFFHVAINIGMTIGLLPVIGIPLPFFSYGGSALWTFTILLFIFLRFDGSRLELF